jgi:RNA ligase (TIGR02306 family)
VTVNGVTVPHDEVPEDFKKNWVPIVYDGPFEDIAKLRSMANSKERVSGKELHISEGLVMLPYQERRAKDGTRLYVKLLNPNYKETGNEIN